MAEALRKVHIDSHRNTVEETEVPVRGYLLRKGRLIGIYVDEGLIPVEEELPVDAHRHFLEGKVEGRLIIRTAKHTEGEIIEVHLTEGHKSWLISELIAEVVGPGGFEPPTTRL